MENIATEYKSLRKVQSGDAGYRDLAITCVCLANTQGGKIVIGVEDKEMQPPANQKLTDGIINNAVTRLRSLCFNVAVSYGPVETHLNGGEYFTIEIQASTRSIATTSDGKIFVRIGDQCQPVRNEDLQRMVNEKNSFSWELALTGIYIREISVHFLQQFAEQIRASMRVKQHIKDLSDIEIAEYYNLVIKNQLTNLGLLWLGNAQQRTRITYPITVQYIVYDGMENKVRKEVWYDYQLNPKELLFDIELQAIELTYYEELPQGLFRKHIRHYDEKVIRELLINAIAHKDYTISGDIFIKVYKDRLEVTNPGGLPLGITKNNILHSTNRRNPHLIKVLHDFELMEGEGSGYNLMYEVSSRDGKAFPVPESDFNSTSVIQSSVILNKDAIQLNSFIANHYQLSQKEFIVIGIVIRYRKIGAPQLTKELQLADEERLRTYVSRLIDQKILISRGVKKGKEYLMNPQLLADSKVNIKPSLKTIEQPRLVALLEETLRHSSNLSILQIHEQLVDVSIEDIRKSIYKMLKIGLLETAGGKRNRTYKLAKKK